MVAIKHGKYFKDGFIIAVYDDYDTAVEEIEKRGYIKGEGVNSHLWQQEEDPNNAYWVSIEEIKHNEMYLCREKT